MDSHYHEEDGVMREITTHRSVCPVCAPKADVPVTPIRRPHRKTVAPVVNPPEAA